MRNVRRSQVAHNRKVRNLVFLTIGILLFFYLSLKLIFGESGLLRYMELKSLKYELLAETSAVKKQNEDIQDQTKSLQRDSDTIEGIAREYGLTREGELIFKFEGGDPEK